MVRSLKHIEIVRSSVSGLSSMSVASSLALKAVLSKHYSDVIITNIDSLLDLETLASRCPDLVFLGMEYLPVKDVIGKNRSDSIWLSDFLDSHDIAYTGSARSAHELARNKPLAKQCVLDAGLSTSNYYIVEKDRPTDITKLNLRFPLFVKPANRGGGFGIDSDSVAINYNQLQSKICSINTRFKSDALVEEYLSGREFSVAILKEANSSKHLAMPIELVAPVDERGSRLLSSEVKSSNTEQALEVKDKDIKSRVTTLAIDVFNALGGRDYGRIDIRLDALGIPQFLEANLIPSLIMGYGSFPKACMLNIGLEYEPMILQLVQLGLSRNLTILESLPELIDMNPIFSVSAKGPAYV